MDPVGGVRRFERSHPLYLHVESVFLAESERLERAELRRRQQRSPTQLPDDTLLVGATGVAQITTRTAGVRDDQQH